MHLYRIGRLKPISMPPSPRGRSSVRYCPILSSPPTHHPSQRRVSPSTASLGPRPSLPPVAAALAADEGPRCVLEHTGVGDASATMLVGRLLGKERVVCGPSTGLSGSGFRVQIPVDRGEDSSKVSLYEATVWGTVHGPQAYKVLEDGYLVSSFLDFCQL